MIVKTKYKIGRRLGSSVFEKCQTPKFALSASKKGQAHNTKRRSMPSDYGLKLIEKQKLRYSYGLKEKQLSTYVKKAIANRDGITIENLFSDLEKRLDNVVYKLGLAPTRAMARQMVSHGHITINGRRLNIPSYSVRLGDKIAVRAGSVSKGMFSTLSERMKDYKVPAWLKFDEKKKEGLIDGKPVMEEMGVDLKAVIEFYNR